MPSTRLESIRSLVMLAMILAVLALATACVTVSEPAPATGKTPAEPAGKPEAKAEPQRELQPVTLRVDWFHSSYHSPFFLGIEKGWYREAGFDLEITEGRGSGNVLQLVGNQTDTFGFAAGEAVVRGGLQGIDAVSVASIMPKNSDAIFVMLDSGIEEPAQLDGKTIATTPGGVSDALLPAFLQNVGLSVDDVEIVPVDPAAKVQLLLQGRVDAMNAPAWSLGYFEAGGGARSFLYADVGVQVVGYSIVTHRANIEQDPDMVRRFVEATMRSWEYAKANPEESLEALERASEENRAEDVMRRNRQDFPAALGIAEPAVDDQPWGYHSESDWEEMIDLLLEYQVIDERPESVSDYYTNQFFE